MGKGRQQYKNRCGLPYRERPVNGRHLETHLLIQRSVAKRLTGWPHLWLKWPANEGKLP